MRIMHDASGINDGRYVDIRWYVKKHVSGKSGIAHVRDAYASLFSDYAFPGGYQVMFITEGGDVLCGECAKQAFIMEGEDITADIYYEGPTEYCDGCNKEIESAYGEPLD